MTPKLQQNLVACTALFSALGAVAPGQAQCPGPIAPNLIRDANFECGPGANTFFTNYNLSGDDLGPGYYDIRQFPQFWNPFFDSCPDHTVGDIHNFMMVVDGTNDNDAAVWAQEFNVLPNTAYLVRYWLVTLTNLQGPTILTRIRRESPPPAGGFVNLSNDQFAYQHCTWQSHESVWFSGDTTRITLILMDQEGAVSGNDFGLDDLEFVDCGPHVNVSPTDQNVPPGGTALFAINASSYAQIRWQRDLPGVGWTNLANGPTGTGSTISGAIDSPTLSVVNVSAQDAGGYRALVSSSCYTITTDPANLTVEVTFTLGDLNCDGLVNGFDANAFALALVNPAGYAVAFPDCNILAADIDGNGVVDANDIAGFIQCALNGGCP